MSHDDATSASFESTVLKELSWRGYIKHITHDELDEALNQKLTLYCGFDPSADSLHAGNLVSIVGLAHFRRHGHSPMALVGGATGMIGDPSGKSSERDLLDDAQLEKNLAGISTQLRAILDRSLSMHAGELQAQAREEIPIVNNADWMKKWSFIDFLRDVGKHFRVNHMIQKTSVKERLTNREQGISYTEFSYMLIQGYDFLHLFNEHGCTLQVGGSDQWGNITAGTDLIRSSRKQSAFGMTFPLLTDAQGKKYGKSEGGAIWLDPERTSAYQFFQYWRSLPDEEMPQLLRTFTFLPQHAITDLLEQPNKPLIQHTLAYEVTALVHGIETAERVVRASKVLYGGEMDGLSDADLADVFAEVPSTQVNSERLKEGIPLLDLFVEVGLEKSKGAARRKLEQGGIYMNNKRVEDVSSVVGEQDMGTETVIFLRSGKKNKHLVRISK